MGNTILEQTIIDTQDQLATMQSLMDSLVSERAHWTTTNQHLRAVNAELVAALEKARADMCSACWLVGEFGSCVADCEAAQVITTALDRAKEER